MLRSLVCRSRDMGLLGRWSLTQNVVEIDRKVELANHDHCGGELCSTPVNIVTDDKEKEQLSPPNFKNESTKL